MINRTLITRRASRGAATRRRGVAASNNRASKDHVLSKDNRELPSDNRGLSLVELIVAFTILAIISGIMLGFMVTSSNMYRNVSTEVSLQLQSQIVMAQLKEYIVDCNEEMTFDSVADTLTIKNSNGEVHRFELRSDDKIYYNSDELATNVSVFSVVLDYNYGASGATVSQATVTLVFKKNMKTYTESQIIALRNETVTSAN